MYQLTGFFNLELFYYKVYREQRKTAGELQLAREKGCHIHKKEEGRREKKSQSFSDGEQPENPAAHHVHKDQRREHSTEALWDSNYGGGVRNFSF